MTTEFDILPDGPDRYYRPADFSGVSGTVYRKTGRSTPSSAEVTRSTRSGFIPGIGNWWPSSMRLTRWNR